MRARFNLGNDLGRRKDVRQSSEVSQTADAKQSTSSSSVNYHFIRDMSIVGLLRGATVVLGLIALEHVPVSFVETIKADIERTNCYSSNAYFDTSCGRANLVFGVRAQI